jgi:hypothetical protein
VTFSRLPFRCSRSLRPVGGLENQTTSFFHLQPFVAHADVEDRPIYVPAYRSVDCRVDVMGRMAGFYLRACRRSRRPGLALRVCGLPTPAARGLPRRPRRPRRPCGVAGKGYMRRAEQIVNPWVLRKGLSAQQRRPRPRLSANRWPATVRRPRRNPHGMRGRTRRLSINGPISGQSGTRVNHATIGPGGHQSY